MPRVPTTKHPRSSYRRQLRQQIWSDQKPWLRWATRFLSINAKALPTGSPITTRIRRTAIAVGDGQDSGIHPVSTCGGEIPGQKPPCCHSKLEEAVVTSHRRILASRAPVPLCVGAEVHANEKTPVATSQGFRAQLTSNRANANSASEASSDKRLN